MNMWKQKGQKEAKAPKKTFYIIIALFDSRLAFFIETSVKAEKPSEILATAIETLQSEARLKPPGVISSQSELIR